MSSGTFILTLSISWEQEKLGRPHKLIIFLPN
jgi:hypothetical protein